MAPCSFLRNLLMHPMALMPTELLLSAQLWDATEHKTCVSVSGCLSGAISWQLWVEAESRAMEGDGAGSGLCPWRPIPELAPGRGMGLCPGSLGYSAATAGNSLLKARSYTSIRVGRGLFPLGQDWRELRS